MDGTAVLHNGVSLHYHIVVVGHGLRVGGGLDAFHSTAAAYNYYCSDIFTLATRLLIPTVLHRIDRDPPHPCGHGLREGEGPCTPI